jgi:hypothetical protein
MWRNDKIVIARWEKLNGRWKLWKTYMV